MNEFKEVLFFVYQALSLSHWGTKSHYREPILWINLVKWIIASSRISTCRSQHAFGDPCQCIFFAYLDSGYVHRAVSAQPKCHVCKILLVANVALNKLTHERATALSHMLIYQQPADTSLIWLTELVSTIQLISPFFICAFTHFFYRYRIKALKGKKSILDI